MRLFAVAALIFASTYVAAEASEPVALFDQGHGQRFLANAEGPLDLSGLAAVMRDKGFAVHVSASKLSDDLLAQINTLVISGPFTSYSAEETRSVRRFIERGGSVAIMLHIGHPAAALVQPLGIDFSNSVIREVERVIDGNDRNFSITDLASHQIFAGIASFAIYGGWALDAFGDNVVTIARTSKGAWIDLDGNNHRSEGDASEAFGVVAVGTGGTGRFVVFGDDTLFQNKFLHENNKKLAENLAVWLRP